MRTALALLVGLQLGFGSTPIGAQSLAPAVDFLSAVPDIPLAEGVVEIADGTLVFDKPQGRIVQVTALRMATKKPTDIADFYRHSLPNLGWQLFRRGIEATDNQQNGHHNSLTFTRKGEILRISFAADLVIFDLTPN